MPRDVIRNYAADRASLICDQSCEFFDLVSGKQDYSVRTMLLEICKIKKEKWALGFPALAFSDEEFNAVISNLQAEFGPKIKKLPPHIKTWIGVLKNRISTDKRALRHMMLLLIRAIAEKENKTRRRAAADVLTVVYDAIGVDVDDSYLD